MVDPALAAAGGVLAWQDAKAGPGGEIAEVQPGRVSPTLDVDAGFWCHPREIVPTAIWAYQNAHDRRSHRRHATSRQPERHSLAKLAPALATQVAPHQSPAAVDGLTASAWSCRLPRPGSVAD